MNKTGYGLQGTSALPMLRLTPVRLGLRSGEGARCPETPREQTWIPAAGAGAKSLDRNICYTDCSLSCLLKWDRSAAGSLAALGSFACTLGWGLRRQKAAVTVLHCPDSSGPFWTLASTCSGFFGASLVRILPAVSELAAAFSI